MQPLQAYIRVAKDKIFRPEGVTFVNDEIGGQTESKTIYVAPRLATEMIQGAAFMDKKITKIEKIRRKVVSNRSHEVAIVKRIEQRCKKVGH